MTHYPAAVVETLRRSVVSEAHALAKWYDENFDELTDMEKYQAVMMMRNYRAVMDNWDNDIMEPV